MRKGSFIFLISCFGFIIQAKGQSYNNQGLLLWEIKNSSTTSYLWGSIHTNDKRVFNFPDSLYYALSNTKNLALEVNVFDLFIDKDPRKFEPEILLDNKGNLYTTSENPTESYYGDEDGMPQFMDAYFQQFALLSGRNVFALESIYEQTKSLSELPFYSDPAMRDYNSGSEKTLLDVYLEGDLEKIDKFLKGELAPNKEAYNKIIIARNENMVKRMDTLIQAKSTFIVVGAGHLYGPKGILQLLKNQGYFVRPVSLVSQGEGTSFKKEIRSYSSYIYNDKSETGLQIRFPGTPLIEENIESKTVSYKELGQGNVYAVEIYSKDSTLSLLEYAEIYIAAPPNSPYKYGVQEDGSEYVQGLTDEYPGGLKWVRIMVNNKIVVISKAYGGNKFMNSNRPFSFFNNVILEDE